MAAKTKPTKPKVGETDLSGALMVAKIEDWIKRDATASIS